MIRREQIRRAYKWVLLSTVVAGLLLWVLDKVWSSEFATIGLSILVCIVVLALPVGLYLEKVPEEIEYTGDQVFDDEIDRVLRERESKKKG
jgi:hypothetical protein